jgi:integrase
MAIYRRGSVFWWKTRLRFSSVPPRPILIRISLRTASPNQARSRAAQLDLAKDAIMEQMQILRRNVKADDLPALYKRAFERELDRIIVSQFEEPGRTEDHLAVNRHYARYFTLLATEPRLLDGSIESFREFIDRGLSEEDAEALSALASRHNRRLPISHGQLMDDLRQQGVTPSERNLAASGRVAAAAYRDANIEGCGELGSPLAEEEIWPLPPHLERLAKAAQEFSKEPQGSAEVGSEIAATPKPSCEVQPAPGEAPLLSHYARQALAKKIADGAWHEDRTRDINGAVAIFVAANGDIPVNGISQKHLIAMKDLFARLPVVYGRMRHDENGTEVRETIEEALARGDKLRQEWDEDPTAADARGVPYVGLSLTTQRKHLTWISALITHLEGHDPDLAPGGLNFTAVRKTLVNPKRQGDRHSVRNNQKRNTGRLPWNPDELRQMLQTPVWQGCAGLWNRFEPGEEVIHDGSYWVLPLLISTLARSDEIAGLAVADVVLDCEVPYFHIRETHLRRIKTISSTRRVPIAKKLLNLGFAEYVTAIRQAGHQALFPEFRHKSMDFDKCFYKDLFDPLRRRVFPNGTSRKRGRKDVDVHSIRTLGFNVLEEEENRTGKKIFDIEHREGLGGHEPGSTARRHYETDYEPHELVELVKVLADLIPDIPKRPLNLRPLEHQKFGKPRGRRKKQDES